jgi:hypothetical protein
VWRNILPDSEVPPVNRILVAVEWKNLLFVVQRPQWVSVIRILHHIPPLHGGCLLTSNGQWPLPPSTVSYLHELLFNKSWGFLLESGVIPVYLQSECYRKHNWHTTNENSKKLLNRGLICGVRRGIYLLRDMTRWFLPMAHTEARPMRWQFTGL